METKTMNIKKGTTTIKDIIITMLIGIMIFGGLVSFVNYYTVENNKTFPLSYNHTYTTLLAQQNELDHSVKDIRNATTALTEVQLGDFAFFGIKGVLKLMTLPLSLIDIAFNSANMVLKEIPILGGINTTITLIIMVIILFTVIKFITSRGTDA